MPVGKTFVRRLAVGLCFALPWLAGCAAFHPMKGIPARYVPDDIKASRRNGTRSIDVSLLSQNWNGIHRVDTGDVLGIYVGGVLGKLDENPPVQFPQNSDYQPAVGIPVPVREDGTISLPMIGSINVRGKTIRETEDALRQSYTNGPAGRELLKPGEERILVSLQRARQTRVLVIRQDSRNEPIANAAVGLLNIGTAKRGSGKAVSLPAYRNDVLNALVATDGLPGLDAENAVYVIRRKIGDLRSGWPANCDPAELIRQSGLSDRPVIRGQSDDGWQYRGLPNPNTANRGFEANTNFRAAPQNGLAPRLPSGLQDSLNRNDQHGSDQYGEPSQQYGEAPQRYSLIDNNATGNPNSFAPVRTNQRKPDFGPMASPSIPSGFGNWELNDQASARPNERLLPQSYSPTPLNPPPTRLPNQNGSPKLPVFGQPGNKPPAYQPPLNQYGPNPALPPVPPASGPGYSMPQNSAMPPNYSMPVAPPEIPPSPPFGSHGDPPDLDVEDEPAPRDIGLVDGHRIIRIPIRLRPDEHVEIRQEDIILNDGDIVFIESRDTEVFFTGGLLGGGQFTLPRDFDLDILEAIAVATSRNGTAGAARQIGGVSALNSDVTISPSNVVIIRKLPEGGEVPIKIDLYKARSDQSERLFVQPGDYVYLQYTPCEAVAAFVERHLLEGALFGVFAQSVNRTN